MNFYTTKNFPLCTRKPPGRFLYKEGGADPAKNSFILNLVSIFEFWRWAFECWPYMYEFIAKNCEIISFRRVWRSPIFHPPFFFSFVAPPCQNRNQRDLGFETKIVSENCSGNFLWWTWTPWKKINVIRDVKTIFFFKACPKYWVLHKYKILTYWLRPSNFPAHLHRLRRQSRLPQAFPS